MDSKRNLMKEKLKEKRKTVKINGDESSSIFDDKNSTSFQMENASDGENKRLESLKMLEDVEKADGLVKDLEARHLEKKKELNRSLRTTGDTSGEIKKAQIKFKNKFRNTNDDNDTLQAENSENSYRNAEVSLPDAAVIKINEQGRLQVSKKGAPDGLNSLKEKLRSKVQSGMKVKSETSRQEEPQPQRTLKGRRDQPVTATRFDENVLGKENLELEDQLSKSQEIRNTWKRAIDKVKVSMPSYEEQYDFFTNTYDNIDNEAERRNVITSAGTEDANEPKDLDRTEEETDLLLKAEELRGGKLWTMTGTEYVSNQQKITNEQKVFYVPSSIQVPFSDKKNPDTQLRDLSNEGIYIGKKPLVLAKEKNKMENRLLHQPDGLGKKWFGEDGEIISLPDPIKENPSRPSMIGEPDPAIQAYYKKAIVKEFDSRYIDGTTDSGGQYRLDVDINILTFSHHELMSREHVLTSKLTTLCKQYQERSKINIVRYYEEKIRVLRNSILHLKSTLQNFQGDDVEAGARKHANLQRRLNEYIREIKEVRKTCEKEELNDRELLRNIVKTWTSIKSLRSYQGFTNTPIKLNFTKIETNRLEDKERIKSEITEELTELRQDHEALYQNQMLEYNELHKKYIKQLQAKKEAKVRIKKRKKQIENDPENVELIEEDKKDQAVVAESDLEKPLPPQKFDEKAERQAINEKYRLIKRRPGEPILIPELTFTSAVTSLSDCPLGEMQRREAVQRCRLYAKIFFNGNPVATTDSRQLSQDFTVAFAQIIPIHIIKWPDSVHIQIFEMGLIKDRLIATVYAAIPGTTVTSSSDDVELDSLDFACDAKRSYAHEAVGSGVPIIFDIPGGTRDEITILTSGHLLTRVCWGVDADGNPLIPVFPSSKQHSEFLRGRDPVFDIGSTAMMDMNKLAEWFSQSRIDPNDPANSDLIHLLRPRAAGESISGPQYFRFEHLQEEFNFVTDDSIESDRRFKLLDLREREVPEFRNMKMIPANSYEISDNVFKEYYKRIEESKREQDTEKDSHRTKVIKFMQGIREQVLERKRLASRQKTLQEIITEESVPNISSIVLNLGNVLAPRRPLRPRRKERKMVVGQNLQDREVKIMVHITRADNVPYRLSDDVNNKNTRTVKPYFEVMFQREKKMTSVAEGPNPCWNEELNLPLRPPNGDYSAASLQSINDYIYINLFDECVIDVLEDDRQRGRVVHTKLDKKWLGGVQIPFGTLFANGMIEGTFRLECPAVLLGYGRDSRKSDGNTELTYVSMFVTIEPPLGSPAEVKELDTLFESNESEDLLDAAAKYMEQVEARFPTRTFMTAVVDINGQTVFVTRYFKPLEAPQDVLSMPGSKEMNVARYVSLIPYISDVINYPGLCDIWSTCDQFLQMLTGDEEEHAVLLTNYFLHLGMNAFLCVGMAIPEGITAYTLVIEEGKVWIWNALKGERYSATDTFIPLVSVGCLINDKNIWANVQKFDQPNRMNFNINDSKSWRPFFTPVFTADLSTVQPQQLLYHETDKFKVREQQERLEQSLKDKFEKDWRPQNVTRWNRNNMQTFRSILTRMEETKLKDMSKQQQTEQEHPFKNELDSVRANYKLSGFTLNMPYTDEVSIAESVYTTGVWDNDNPGVEFALAVHIHPYPSSVLSVWIYVASLERSRS